MIVTLRNSSPWDESPDRMTASSPTSTEVTFNAFVQPRIASNVSALVGFTTTSDLRGRVEAYFNSSSKFPIIRVII